MFSVDLPDGETDQAPDVAEQLHGRAIGAFNEGNLEQATQLLGQVCGMPDAPAHAFRDYAVALGQQSRIPDAERAARRAVQMDSGNAAAWETLGTILFARQANVGSVMCFEQAVFLDADFARARVNLAVALHRVGRLRDARKEFVRLVGATPDDDDIALKYAVLLSDLGEYRPGLTMVEGVLHRQPDTALAWIVASELERGLGRFGAALQRIDRALELVPDSPDVRVRRAENLWRLGRFEEALRECDHVLATAPDDPDAMQVRALALKGLNRLDEAAKAFDAACNGSPSPAAVIADRAWFAAEMGHRHWAVDELKRAIDLAPDLVATRYYHAYFARLKKGSPYLLRLEAMANNEDVPHRDRIAASFAVGKTYLDQDCDTAAFAWLRRANRLKRSAADYEEAREAARIDAIIQAYPSTLPKGGTAGERAIFVFGMPRSGTTLVEQILATHSAVHGAGEPTCLRDIAETVGYPEQADTALTEAGSRYLATVGSGVALDKRIVDKMPSNFLYAGLIPAILPGARMIHCRRDPLDTCFSCYSLLFGEGQEYSYDLGELGRYYRLYSRLMAHWRQALPPETFIEIDYESLIAEPETQIRRLLEFCDLPWEDACLSPHKTGRRVGSASLDQVRSPIYKTSIGRARRFLPWLSELVEALTPPR